MDSQEQYNTFYTSYVLPQKNSLYNNNNEWTI